MNYQKSKASFQQTPETIIAQTHRRKQTPETISAQITFDHLKTINFDFGISNSGPKQSKCALKQSDFVLKQSEMLQNNLQRNDVFRSCAKTILSELTFQFSKNNHFRLLNNPKQSLQKYLSKTISPKVSLQMYLSKTISSKLSLQKYLSKSRFPKLSFQRSPLRSLSTRGVFHPNFCDCCRTQGLLVPPLVDCFKAISKCFN